MLTQNRLKEVLHYNSLTGIFTWAVDRGRSIKAGTVAGYQSPAGYIFIRIDDKLYRASRLAWLYVYGYLPEPEIDHINRVRYHNWIDNLREVSHQCNARNCKLHATNTSGIKGVCWSKSSHKWRAYITVNDEQKHLGLYVNFDNAACARFAGEQCLDWNGCNVNSPAYRYVKELLCCS